jgi:hypothetical protein
MSIEKPYCNKINIILIKSKDYKIMKYTKVAIERREIIRPPQNEVTLGYWYDI